MVQPDWQVTATTIYCDAVDDDVTLLIYKDRSAKCTGHRKYVENPTKEALKELKKRSKKLGRQLKCEGPLDHRVTDYCDKIFAEQEAKAPK